MSYDIGEKPGKGTYQCQFDHTVVLDQNSDALPPCSSCGSGQHTKWRKIS